MSALVYLRSEAARLSSPLRSICDEVLNDARFQYGFASRKHHHHWVGGLVDHTAEVMSHSLAMGNAFNANLDIIRAAAICHDYYKIFEYEVQIGGEISGTWYRDNIGHVAGSMGWFYERAVFRELAPELRDSIAHAMIAHHGHVNWGSPIEPKSIEAFILHTADMLSAVYHLPRQEAVSGPAAEGLSL